MNKHLVAVKAILDKKKAAVSAKLAQAALSPEQKTQLDDVMSQIDAAIAELDAAAEDATADQIAAIFSKAVETLSAVTDQSVNAVQAEVAAKLQALQAKITGSENGKKKFSARLDLVRMKQAAKDSDGFRPYSAGVDVTAWTPEATIEDVEIFHPLIGVAAGFNVGSTATTSIKLRKFGVSGNAVFVSVVANHGIKPAIETVGSQNVVNVNTFAGVVEGIADEDLEDNPGLQNEVEQEALDNLAQYENVSAKALLDTAAKAFANANFGKKAGADAKTALAAVIDQVRQALGNRQSDICLAMNSSEWAKLRDLRNGNGTPIDIQSVIGDVVQITDNTIATDTFYCWAKKFANIKIYKNKTADWYKGVKVTTDNGTITAVTSEWRTDEGSLRVRQRGMMYVSDDTTVVKGKISGVITALTPAP